MMTRIETGAAIDGAPVGAFQIKLLLLCAAILFIDGFDTQAIGYVAPALAKDLHLGPAQLAPLFSAGLIGLTLGAMLLGPLADRVGRRRIIIASVVLFGFFSLATGFARDLHELLALRFLTGLGLGGAMPNTVALTAEFSPKRRRATMVMVMFCGFSVGAALGGLLAAALLPHWGWRAIFLAGGIAPLLLAPLLAKALPESIAFLALKGSEDVRIAALLSRIKPVPPDAQFFTDSPRQHGLPVAALFADGRAVTTALFWLVFFMSLLDLYLLSNWLPTVLNQLGASLAGAAAVGAMLQVGGVVGTISLGRLIDRFSFRALALTYLVAASAIAAIGFSGHNLPLATVAIFCAGFGVVGGQIAANALAAAYYPMTMRATGVGWALGVGRIGSIVGPLLGGWMLAAHHAPQSLFLAAVGPALLASLAAFALSRLR